MLNAIYSKCQYSHLKKKRDLSIFIYNSSYILTSDTEDLEKMRGNTVLYYTYVCTARISCYVEATLS